MSTPYNFSQGDAPLELQTSFWNKWNADFREHDMSAVSARQAEVILGWLEDTGKKTSTYLTSAAVPGGSLQSLADTVSSRRPTFQTKC